MLGENSKNKTELDEISQTSLREKISEEPKKEYLNTEKLPHSKEQAESVIIEIDEENQSQEEKKGFWKYTKRILGDKDLTFRDKVNYTTGRIVDVFNDDLGIRMPARLRDAEEWLSGWKKEHLDEMNNGGREHWKIPRTIKGSLNLRGFHNLRKVEFLNNGLTDLDLTDSPNLEEVICPFNDLNKLVLHSKNKVSKIDLSYNRFTKLDDISPLNSEKLIELKLNNNDFDGQDVSCFSHFTKLRVLWIDKIEIDNKPSKYGNQYGGINRFVGSLEAFKDMEDLKDLDINYANLDRDGGIELLIKRINELRKRIELGDNNEPTPQFSSSSLSSEKNLSGRIANLKKKVEELKIKIKEKWKKVIQVKDNKDLVAGLKSEISDLRNQLNLKEQELIDLARQCLNYLKLICSLYEKQKETKELERSIKKENKIELLGKFGKTKEEIGGLKKELEIIIEQNKPKRKAVIHNYPGHNLIADLESFFSFGKDLVEMINSSFDEIGDDSPNKEEIRKTNDEAKETIEIIRNYHYYGDINQNIVGVGGNLEIREKGFAPNQERINLLLEKKLKEVLGENEYQVWIEVNLKK